MDTGIVAAGLELNTGHNYYWEAGQNRQILAEDNLWNMNADVSKFCDLKVGADNESLVCNVASDVKVRWALQQRLLNRLRNPRNIHDLKAFSSRKRMDVDLQLSVHVLLLLTLP